MSNPVLISEQFERAAYSLQESLTRFSDPASQLSVDIERFERSVESFQESVNKLATVLGMQAENDQRKVLGHSMAYTADDFQ